MIIRELQLEDLCALMDLYRLLHESDPVPDPGGLVETWAFLCASPLHLYFGAEESQKLVSSCTVTIVPNLTRGARPYGVIENVITHPEHRRCGYARAVINTAITACRQRNCYKVMLMSSMERKQAHSLYRSLGFEEGSKQAYVIRII